jgi:hypothetical protein
MMGFLKSDYGLHPGARLALRDLHPCSLLEGTLRGKVTTNLIHKKKKLSR